MKKVCSLIIGMSMLVPSFASAAAPMWNVQKLPTAEVVDQILGSAMPDLGVRVSVVKNPRTNSVHMTDNAIDLTNRVLSRKIRRESVRVHANLYNEPMYGDIEQWTFGERMNARVQQSSAETHCQARLRADGIKNEAGHCGPGYARYR